MKIKNFIFNMLKGGAVGIAMIIPGVSGGTLAVLLGIYEKIIDSISNLGKKFKESFLFLLPVVLGALVAVIAAYFPLKLALDRVPLATVLLFAGLMVGSMPKMIKDGIKQGFKKINVLSLVLPLAAVIGICFIPGLGEADLSSSMPVWGYFVLILIGAVASCALVIPGISGSMLLLIFGYYNAIFDTVSSLKTDFGHSLLVLFCFAAGLILGFFSIAKLMKVFLNKFPRGTTWAINGFVIGSIPAIFITFSENFKDVLTQYPIDGIQIGIGAVLCVAGIIATFALTAYVESKNKKKEEIISPENNQN